MSIAMRQSHGQSHGQSRARRATRWVPSARLVDEPRRVALWIAAGCALGGVLLAQMAGLLTPRRALPTLLAAGLLLCLLCLIGLLVTSPLGGVRAWDAAALYAMTPAAFERHVAALFAASGYAVRVVGGAGDGGVDVRVWRDGWSGVVQCKRYRPDRALGPAAVRELVGTRAHERARVAWLATTARLSPAARRLAEEEGVVVLDAPALAACARRPGRLSGTGRAVA